ncbi:MAG TPA: hypothetical protein VG943_13935 [Caulobacterales bacterium]|nr:hypothetical protein [Caulobacterales bacterium]
MRVDQQARQGDVPVVRVDALPEGARALKRDEHNRVVLAHGEVTGHAHTLRAKGVCGFTTLDNDDIEFIVVGGSGATLRHELVSGAKAEHDAITLARGVYEIPVQVEYMPKEAPRVVAD